jgi:hypothetical protein
MSCDKIVVSIKEFNKSGFTLEYVENSTVGLVLDDSDQIGSFFEYEDSLHIVVLTLDSEFKFIDKFQQNDVQHVMIYRVGKYVEMRTLNESFQLSDYDDNIFILNESDGNGVTIPKIHFNAFFDEIKGLL